MCKKNLSNNYLGEQLRESELCPDDLLKGQEAAFEIDIARLHARKSEFVKVSCPACNQENDNIVFTKFDFTFHRCSACSTIYMSPRPSETLMSDYYSNSENYAYWAKYIFPASEATRRQKIHKPWLKRINGYCIDFKIDRGTLLEVGPGFGTFSAVATESNLFNRVVAVEPTPELAEACRKRGVEVIEKRIEDIGAELDTVDVVVAFEVIEHLFDPSFFLKAARSKLSKNGLLVLSCPNGLGFDIAMLGSSSLAVDAEHVNLFNPTSLSRLLEDIGFEVLHSETPGRLDAEFVRDSALEGKINLDPFLQRVLVDEWDQYGWAFQRFIANQGLSSHMWIVAKVL
jgi:2-polyprenyl-3-methyl-5-hydroxy-6-metoxy-1,4-benzoquinol methylase/ribosomal protein S27E